MGAQSNNRSRPTNANRTQNKRPYIILYAPKNKSPEGASNRRVGQHSAVLGHEGGPLREEYFRAAHQRRLPGHLRQRDSHRLVVGKGRWGFGLDEVRIRVRVRVVLAAKPLQRAPAGKKRTIWVEVPFLNSSPTSSRGLFNLSVGSTTELCFLAQYSRFSRKSETHSLA